MRMLMYRIRVEYSEKSVGDYGYVNYNDQYDIYFFIGEQDATHFDDYSFTYDLYTRVRDNNVSVGDNSPINVQAYRDGQWINIDDLNIDHIVQSMSAI